MWHGPARVPTQTSTMAPPARAPATQQPPPTGRARVPASTLPVRSPTRRRRPGFRVRRVRVQRRPVFPRRLARAPAWCSAPERCSSSKPRQAVEGLVSETGRPNVPEEVPSWGPRRAVVRRSSPSRRQCAVRPGRVRRITVRVAAAARVPARFRRRREVRHPGQVRGSNKARLRRMEREVRLRPAPTRLPRRRRDSERRRRPTPRRGSSPIRVEEAGWPTRAPEACRRLR